MSQFVIDRLALIGVGLIGGSLVQALKSRGAVNSVIGVGRDPENLELAVKLGAIDEATHDIRQAVDQADMVVIATPVLTMGQVLAALKPALKTEAFVTDVGSVKGLVVKQAAEHLGHKAKQFVPGHPIAGSEYSGVKAAFADLFEDHRVILTPSVTTDPQAVQAVTAMWSHTGAVVEQMTAAQHDKILATTSHLPHVLAYSLMRFLSEQPEQEEYFRLAAGGLYDFTRIASSDPLMWRDICIANQAQLSQQLRAFSSELDSMADHIEASEASILKENFTAAKIARAKVADFRKRASPSSKGE